MSNDLGVKIVSLGVGVSVLINGASYAYGKILSDNSPEITRATLTATTSGAAYAPVNLFVLPGQAVEPEEYTMERPPYDVGQRAGLLVNIPRVSKKKFDLP